MLGNARGMKSDGDATWLPGNGCLERERVEKGGRFEFDYLEGL